MSAKGTIVDTHCHIHDSEFAQKFKDKSPDTMIQEAATEGVRQLICVGTDYTSSEQALEFCASRDACYASVALHPHEAANMDAQSIAKAMEDLRSLAVDSRDGLVAIGEAGLDYFYHDDPRTHELQGLLLREHLSLAKELDLPLIFHVRDAFDEFFRAFDEFSGLRGVIHSFSATEAELAGTLQRGLYVGLNGIMTFTKRADQLSAAKAVPLDRLILETDAPFLTPVPFRGKMCEPKHVVLTANFLSELRGESYEELTSVTTSNARKLFGI